MHEILISRLFIPTLFFSFETRFISFEQRCYSSKIMRWLTTTVMERMMGKKEDLDDDSTVDRYRKTYTYDC